MELGNLLSHVPGCFTEWFLSSLPVWNDAAVRRLLRRSSPPGSVQLEIRRFFCASHTLSWKMHHAGNLREQRRSVWQRNIAQERESVWKYRYSWQMVRQDITYWSTTATLSIWQVRTERQAKLFRTKFKELVRIRLLAASRNWHALYLWPNDNNVFQKLIISEDFSCQLN